MTVSEYNSLSISTDSWFCKNCILPNFTDSYFETNNKTTNDCESNTPEFDYVPLTPNTSAVNIEFETDVNNDIFTELKEVRKRHPNQFSCAYLNINSFGYTFCSVKEKELLTTNTVDMLIIAETKLDNTFINSQFAVDNYHLWRANQIKSNKFYLKSKYL